MRIRTNAIVLVVMLVSLLLLERPGREARAATLTVTTAADVVDPTDGVLSLREAIAEALSGDTVDFDANLSGQTIILAQGQLTIDKDLTIEGLGASLLSVNGNRSSRIFEIVEGTVVAISGVTITSGFVFDDGGGIFNAGTLTLTDAVVRENATEVFGSGGGIFNAGTLTVIDSTVSGNTARLGGGVANGNAVLELTNSTVTANIAVSLPDIGSFGGGIDNVSGTVQLTHSTVKANSADVGGGIRNFDGTLQLTHSTVSSNTADFGGGIHNSGAALTQPSQPDG